MKRTLFTTAAVAALALTAATAPALANVPTTDQKVESNSERRDNGGYATTSSKTKTDAAGTTVKSETKAELDVNDDGTSTKTTKQEHITDPKGTLNERAQTTETKVKRNDDGYSTETRTSNSNAAGTSTLTKQQREVKRDAQGNVIETTKTDKVVDPKGLMNREATSTEQKRINGELVENNTDR